MKRKWSKQWIRSRRPGKQRKYVYNAPLHVRQKLLGTHLSPELRKKYALRTVEVRKGDTVKVIRGQYKKKSGKVNKVNHRRLVVYIEGIDRTRKDGTKAFIPLRPSNLIVTELDLTDKKRKAKIERNLKEAKHG